MERIEQRQRGLRPDPRRRLPPQLDQPHHGDARHGQDGAGAEHRLPQRDAGAAGAVPLHGLRAARPHAALRAGVRASSTSEKIGEALLYEDLSETLRTEDLPAAVQRIVDLIKEHRPAFVFIDSFKALHSFSTSPTEFRTVAVGAVRRCSPRSRSRRSGSASTRPRRSTCCPSSPSPTASSSSCCKKRGTGDVRYLRVTKLRGSAFAVGEHAYRIGAGGLELFPRLVTPEAPVSYDLATARSSSGVPALDAMLSEGLWKGSSTIVFGPPGSGKTLLGLHFIFKGIERGEKGLIATHAGEPHAAAAHRHRVRLGPRRRPSTSGMLTLLYMSPVGTYIDEVVGRVSRRALRGGQPAAPRRQPQRPRRRHRRRAASGTSCTRSPSTSR